MSEILIVEDDTSSRLILRKSLEEMHSIREVKTLKEAFTIVDQLDFDMILLDVTLPDGDGFQFLAHLRNQSRFKNTPVLFISGTDSISNQVMGYALGADDYIIKPVQPLVLQAKVNAKLNAIRRRNEELQELIIGNLRISLTRQKASITSEGTEHELDLTPLEFKMLSFFSNREEHVFTRAQLIDILWADNTHVVDRTIDTHISHLRKKLRGSTHTIESVHGVGYRFVISETTEKNQAA